MRRLCKDCFLHSGRGISQSDYREYIRGNLIIILSNATDTCDECDYTRQIVSNLVNKESEPEKYIGIQTGCYLGNKHHWEY